MYCSFSASVEAGLVPHPRRLRLNRPSGELSHPFKCAWSHLLHQPRLTGYSNRGDGTVVKSPCYHPLLTVQGLPCPALFHLNRVTIALESVHRPNCSLQGLGKSGLGAVSYTSHLQGLGKSGLGAVSYDLPGLGTPPSQKIHKAWHVTYSGGHTD